MIVVWSESKQIKIKMGNFFIILIVIAIFQGIQGTYDGTTANKKHFPYLVYVRGPKFYCAGTIISDRHIATAAHCLMDIRRGNSVQVNLDMDKNYCYGGSDGVSVFSTKFWIHENFSMPLAMFDIGIVELPLTINEYVNSTRKVRPIGISTENDVDFDHFDNEVVIAGWGHVRRYYHASNTQFTYMKLINLTECMKYQGHFIETITQDHICTEKIKGMPCDGDSGAGIVSLKTNKLIGILSYVKDAEDGEDIGYNDCKSKVPAVSTRIASYIDWISLKTGLDFSKTEKVCYSEGLVNAANIEKFQDCETIEGVLNITDESFFEMQPDRLIHAFSSVKLIRGSLRISANHENFTDLSFLKNLETIYRDQSIDDAFALVITKVKKIYKFKFSSLIFI